METLIAASDVVPLTDIFRAVFFYAVLAEVIGAPIAWWRVHKLDAWKERPEEMGRLGVLSRYMAKVVGLVVLWAVLMTSAAIIGSRL